MLQIPENQARRSTRAAAQTAPALHANVPDFIKALPDDEAALIPVYMAYSIAAKTFSLQISAPWLSHTSEEGRDAQETGYERLQDILSYIADRLRALKKLRDGWWEYHYLAVLTEHELLCCNNADDVISTAAKADAVVRASKRGRA